MQDYSKNFTDGMAFAKEMFNLVTQLTTYSSTDTARYPVETLTEGGGDCKDLSILFATLLEASNFPFKLQLVYMDSDNPTAPVKPNHCIVALTYSGQTALVDCTAKTGWGYWKNIKAWSFDVTANAAQTTDTQPEVDAANTELQNIKTAMLAYYADGGIWPQNTTVLGKYLAGPVHQNYNVDTQDGYIVSLYGAQGWPGIVFHPGVAGAGSRDGFWAKN